MLADPVALLLHERPALLPALLSAAGKAASSFASHPAWTHERDDLRGGPRGAVAGEAGIVVAKALAKMGDGFEPDDAADYVYVSTIRACDKYLKRSQRRPKEKGVEYVIDAVDTQRDAELFLSPTLRTEDARRHREFVEELLACCDDETDRGIVELQANHEDKPLSRTAVGRRLGIDQATVSRRCERITQRYWERNS